MKPLPQIRNLVAFTAWTSIIADGNNITSKTKNKDFKSLPLCGPFVWLVTYSISYGIKPSPSDTNETGPEVLSMYRK